MKRIFLVSFLLIVITQHIFAINTKSHYTDSFQITAFKAAKELSDNSDTAAFNIYIVDALHGSFVDSDGNPNSVSRVELNSKINSLLEDNISSTTFDSDRMIFQIIAFGNRAGAYSLDISFTPLANSNGDVISAAYAAGNASGNFTNSEMSINDNDNETFYITDGNPFPVSDSPLSSAKDIKIMDPLAPSSASTGSISSDSNGNNLGVSWTVYTADVLNRDYRFWEVAYEYNLNNESARNTSSPRWIVRSAVSMAIDKNTYEQKPQGDYSATVTITLTQD